MVKEVPHKFVACVALDGDNGSILSVVVCLSPDEAFASKNQKHVGIIRDGKFLLSPKATETVSTNEEAVIIRAYFGMKNLLMNMEI
jgi:hypothetical protein